MSDESFDKLTTGTEKAPQVLRPDLAKRMQASLLVESIANDVRDEIAIGTARAVDIFRKKHRNASHEELLQRARQISNFNVTTEPFPGTTLHQIYNFDNIQKVKEETYFGGLMTKPGLKCIDCPWFVTRWALVRVKPERDMRVALNEELTEVVSTKNVEFTSDEFIFLSEGAKQKLKAKFWSSTIMKAKQLKPMTGRYVRTPRTKVLIGRLMQISKELIRKEVEKKSGAKKEAKKQAESDINNLKLEKSRLNHELTKIQLEHIIIQIIRKRGPYAEILGKKKTSRVHETDPTEIEGKKQHGQIISLAYRDFGMFIPWVEKSRAVTKTERTIFPYCGLYGVERKPPYSSVKVSPEQEVRKRALTGKRIPPELKELAKKQELTPEMKDKLRELIGPPVRRLYDTFDDVGCVAEEKPFVEAFIRARSQELKPRHTIPIYSISNTALRVKPIVTERKIKGKIRKIKISIIPEEHIKRMANIIVAKDKTASLRIRMRIEQLNRVKKLWQNTISEAKKVIAHYRKDVIPSLEDLGPAPLEKGIKSLQVVERLLFSLENLIFRNIFKYFDRSGVFSFIGNITNTDGDRKTTKEITSRISRELSESFIRLDFGSEEEEFTAQRGRKVPGKRQTYCYPFEILETLHTLFRYSAVEDEDGNLLRAKRADYVEAEAIFSEDIAKNYDTVVRKFQESAQRYKNHDLNGLLRKFVFSNDGIQWTEKALRIRKERSLRSRLDVETEKMAIQNVILLRLAELMEHIKKELFEFTNDLNHEVGKQISPKVAWKNLPEVLYPKPKKDLSEEEKSNKQYFSSLVKTLPEELQEQNVDSSLLLNWRHFLPIDPNRIMDLSPENRKRLAVLSKAELQKHYWDVMSNRLLYTDRYIHFMNRKMGTVMFEDLRRTLLSKTEIQTDRRAKLSILLIALRRLKYIPTKHLRENVRLIEEHAEINDEGFITFKNPGLLLERMNFAPDEIVRIKRYRSRLDMRLTLAKGSDEVVFDLIKLALIRDKDIEPYISERNRLAEKHGLYDTLTDSVKMAMLPTYISMLPVEKRKGG